MKSVELLLDGIFDEIRPYISKSILDSTIEDYREVFREANSSEPTSAEIDRLISLLIDKGNIKEITENTITDLKGKIIKRVNRKKISSILIDAVFTGMVLLVCFYVLIDGLTWFSIIDSPKLQNVFMDNYALPSLIDSAVLVLAVLIYFIKNLIDGLN